MEWKNCVEIDRLQYLKLGHDRRSRAGAKAIGICPWPAPAAASSALPFGQFGRTSRIDPGGMFKVMQCGEPMRWQPRSR